MTAAWLVAPRPRVVAAIAARHLREIARARLIVWIGMLGALSWIAADDLRSRLGSAILLAALGGTLAVIFAVAGRVADDLASGALMIDLLHGAREVELVVGATLASAIAATPPLLVALAGIVATGLARGYVAVAILLGAWVIVHVVAWSACGVLLGAATPSKANAIILFTFFLFAGIAPASLPVGALPPLIGSVLRTVWSALPLVHHIAALRDMLLLGAPPSAWPGTVLLLTTPACIGLAVWRLTRLEPSERWMT
jgi:hypothetical protein